MTLFTFIVEVEGKDYYDACFNLGQGKINAETFKLWGMSQIRPEP